MSKLEPQLSAATAKLKLRATNHFKAQEWDKAYEFFEQAISQEKESPALYCNIALTACKLGRFQDALQYAEDAFTVSWPGLTKHAVECVAMFLLAL